MFQKYLFESYLNGTVFIFNIRGYLVFVKKRTTFFCL